jgi:hypothetical protein
MKRKANTNKGHAQVELPSWWVYIALSHDMGEFQFTKPLIEKKAEELVMWLRSKDISSYCKKERVL